MKFSSEIQRTDIPVENDWKKIDQIIGLRLNTYTNKEGVPYGYDNLIKMLYDLSELSVSITKYIAEGETEDLLEQIADVVCSIRYLSIITGINEKDISKAVNIKMQREVERIAETDQEKELHIYPIE